jgi:hypothetical protein
VRPYRRALTVAEAVAELERGAGTQFDSAVVGALLAIVAAAVAILMLRRVEVTPQDALPQAASPAFGPNRAATATLSTEFLAGGAEKTREAPG